MSDESVRVYYDADTDRRRLDGRTFAIVGYGSQGHAHALNLRDSGVKDIDGLLAGSTSAEKAMAAGLDVSPVAVDAAAADAIRMPPAARSPTRSRTREGSAARGPGSSRPRSARRPRPISSASRPCSAAASPRW
jgi:hypothetical protein